MFLLAPLLRPHTRQPAAQIAARYTGHRITSQADWDDRLRHAFIRSLATAAAAAAGICRQHRRVNTDRQRWHRTSFLPGRGRTHTAVAVPHGEPKEVSQRDYEDLVDLYPPFSVTAKGARDIAERKRREHMPLAPRLVVTPEQELLPPHTKRAILAPETAEHSRQIKAFATLAKTPLGRMDLDMFWRKYRELQSPRPRYLIDATLHRALRHLGYVENWYQPEGMQRYFQLLNECLGEGVTVTLPIWTTAVSFAGRCVRSLTVKQVKRAIEMWMQMERHGHEANHVTFNILFDVAVKAGRFALADTIYSEIVARGMPLDRWARGSLIFYAGVRGDGDGVRKAFRDFVEAGEIVDTTIMNSVVVSLLRAGEVSAAEHAFERMKHLHRDKFGTKSLQDWRDKKEMKILLNKTAKQLREEKREHECSFFGAPFSSDERREAIQKAAPIAPDADTYMILIKYHANTSGDIDRIWELMDEMRALDFQLHGSTYLHLLRGFHTHGGYPFSAWNHGRLEELWEEIVKACVQSGHVHDVGAKSTDQNDHEPGKHTVSSDDRPDEDSEALNAARYGVLEEHHPAQESGEVDNGSSASHSGEWNASGPGSPESDAPWIFEPIEAMEPRERVVAAEQTPPGDALFHPSRGFGSLGCHDDDDDDDDDGDDGSDFRSDSPDHTTRAPSPSAHATTDRTETPSRTCSANEDTQHPAFEPARRPRMTTSMALAAVRAFYQCMGRPRMLAIWDELNVRWIDQPDMDWPRIKREVDQCVEDADKYVGARARTHHHRRR